MKRKTRNSFEALYRVVDGSLFDAREQYIVHQCNCVTRRAAHLARDVFAKIPGSDVYSTRTSPSVPGTIEIRGRVVALFAQYRPGTVTSERANRVRWFSECLAKLAKVEGLSSVAFPYGIGCGAAGGDWKKYQEMINEFAETNPHVTVRIYRLTQK